MADEPRRSGRATKGQHTKKDELESPAPTSKRQKSAKPKTPKATSAEPALEAEDADDGGQDELVRCICGASEDEGGRMMICCEQCGAWQHNDCMAVTEVEDELPEVYYCEQCRPENHRELLDALRQGVKLYEQRQKEAAKLRRQRKRNKGRKIKGGRQSRVSAVTSEMGEQTSSPAPQDALPHRDASAPQVEPAADSSNGHAQSPLPQSTDSPSQNRKAAGEKRRASSRPDAEDKSAKRRKSGLAQPLKSPALEIENIADLPADRQPAPKALHKQLKDLISERSQKGSYRIPDKETADSLATRLALRIEDGLFRAHGSVPAYAAQFRSIVFNTKKNPALLDGLLAGSLSPSELATMPSDDMASEEKQRENAALKEAADKQAILIQEEGSRMRKTHKGYEMIEDDNAQVNESISTMAPPIRRRESAMDDKEPENADSPVQSGEHVEVELPEDVGDRQPLHVDTSARPRPGAHGRTSSATFNIDQVWSSVHSPDNDQQRQLHARRQSSMAMPQTHGPGDDADVDRLLKDEDDTGATYSPAEWAGDPSVVWHGTVDLPNHARFHASARYAGGGRIDHAFPWTALVPPSITLTGRIAEDVADQYVSNMRGSATNDVTILSLTPTSSPSDQANFAQVYKYFHDRKRWGNVQERRIENIKDFYLVPLEAGAEPLKGCLTWLEDVTIECPRPQDMLLLCLVVKTASPPPSADVTPRNPDGSAPPAIGPGNPGPAPSMTPTMPQGQFSPGPTGPPGGFTNPSPFSQQPQGQQQQSSVPGISPASNSLASQILGPLITSPVVSEILKASDNINEQLLLNLKDILEKVPAARTDLGTFYQELTRVNKEREGL